MAGRSNSFGLQDKSDGLEQNKRSDDPQSRNGNHRGNRSITLREGLEQEIEEICQVPRGVSVRADIHGAGTPFSGH
jgi:hypothetical protein